MTDSRVEATERVEALLTALWNRLGDTRSLRHMVVEMDAVNYSQIVRQVDALRKALAGAPPLSTEPPTRATAKRIADFVANSVMCPEHGYSGPAAPIVDMVDLELKQLLAARSVSTEPASDEWSRVQALREEVVELREEIAQAAAALDNAGAKYADGTLTLAQRIAELSRSLSQGALEPNELPHKGGL